ncbi:MAG: sugar ABC transporter ATP-binding protein [Chloroflexi bacterium]|nr:sugar ABC transporter ATP-binding protein [Chloroflexota bacterium]
MVNGNSFDLVNVGEGGESPHPHLEIRAICKHFGGAQALDDISLTIRRGTIHALVGENGAGKSTLGKIISGVIQPDSGELILNGEQVQFGSPREALENGIAMIQQEIALVPKLTVLKNVFLGIETNHGGLLDDQDTRRRFDELNQRTGFDLQSDSLVFSLSVAEQKKVEILKAIARNAQLLVMDEPTATLPIDEAEKLIEIVRSLRKMGTTVVYVSHFLKEVLSIADDVTVLRNGQLIQTTLAKDETPESLVVAMLGRSMSMAFPPKTFCECNAPVVLSVKGLSHGNDIQDITFDIRAGEIVGLAGLVGSGQSAVARAIFGADRKSSGTVSIDGNQIEIRNPGDAVAAGIALVPENRKTQGLLMRLPVSCNVTLPHLKSISKGMLIQGSEENHKTEVLLKDLDVRPPQPKVKIDSLSGGNQQKVLFGKWLFKRPRLLIADEPTHGVDVGAKIAIYQLVVSLAKEGLAVLLISSELEEVMGLAHRVLVLRQGRIVAEFQDNLEGPSSLTEDAIMRAAFATEKKDDRQHEPDPA